MKTTLNPQLLRDRFKKRKRINSFDYGFGNFLSKSINLLFVLLNKSGGKVQLRYKRLAYFNFIVNITSALEIYLSQLIIKRKDWDEKGVDSMLKQSISVSEAYKIFSKENITREYIIAHICSVQNLSEIETVFSALIGDNRSFFRIIEATPFESWDLDGEPIHQTLAEKHPNWKAVIAEMFDVRNGFIHEGKIPRSISQSRVFEYWNITGDLQLAIEEHFFKMDFDAPHEN